MNVYELVERLGGEIVRGKARVRQGKEYVILGTLTPDGMVFTKEGAALAEEMRAEKPAPAPKRTRKTKAADTEAEPAIFKGLFPELDAADESDTV